MSEDQRIDVEHTPGYDELGLVAPPVEATPSLGKKIGFAIVIVLLILALIFIVSQLWLISGALIQDLLQ